MRIGQGAVRRLGPRRSWSSTKRAAAELNAVMRRLLFRQHYMEFVGYNFPGVPPCERPSSCSPAVSSVVEVSPLAGSTVADVIGAGDDIRPAVYLAWHILLSCDQFDSVEHMSMALPVNYSQAVRDVRELDHKVARYRRVLC